MASELVALLLSEAVPLKVPVVVGAKVTLKEVSWPTFSVRGRLRSLSLKAAAETLALEIVTAVVPMLKITTGKIEVWPTTTLPNFRLVGIRVSVTPVPVSEIVNSLVRFLKSAMLPVNVPVVVGAKLIVNEVERPGLRVSGSDKPLTLKQEPITVTDVNVQSYGLLFVMVTVFLLVVPTATSPKLTLDGTVPKTGAAIPKPVMRISSLRS